MLIGRERELGLITESLERSRLVTLVGPGGVGKTSLARAAVEAGPEGISRHFFADLAPLEAGGLADAMAGDLGYCSFDALVDELRARSALVVLDNCEHLVDAGAELADRLLDRCPEVSLLATSRERLGVADETVVVVEPLSTNGSPSPAVELFLAAADRQGVVLSGNAETVSALARRLDGLPLALELAAARAGSLTPADMLRHLDARSDILSRNRRRGPERQRSLEATVAWSYALLDDDDRRLLAQLSVLPAPFDGPMATAVGGPADAGAELRRLGALVDRSLVVHEPVDGRSWYRLLETIRDFATTRLDERGDRDEVENRVVDHLVATTAQLVDELGIGHSAIPLALGPDFRTRAWAVDRCLAIGRIAACNRLLAPLWFLETVGHQTEAIALIERVVGEQPPERVDTMLAGTLACLYRVVGRTDDACGLAQAVSVLDDGAAGALAHRVLGLVARLAGDWPRAEEHFGSAAAAARNASDHELALEIETHAALTIARAGDPVRASALLERLRNGTRSLGQTADWIDLCRSWINLAVDPGNVRPIVERVEPRAHARGDDWAVAQCRMDEALLLLLEGDDSVLASAARLTAESLELFEQVQNRSDGVLALLVAAAVANRAGRADEALDIAAIARRQDRAGAFGDFEIDMLRRAGLIDGEGDRGREVTVREVIDLMGVLALAAVERGPAADPTSHEAPHERNRFLPDGDGWLIAYRGETTRVADSKGMHDLAALLRDPEAEIAALDLIGAMVAGDSAGSISDTEARRRYQERLHDLDQEIDEAERDHDGIRAERARIEMDRIVEHLSAAYGLRGAERQVATSAEKARSAVRWRIRAAIKRIAAVHPTLGAHLDRSITTGRFCAYRPTEPTTWQTA